MSDSEDEYGPVCATWGSQTATTTDSNENTDAWKNLLDPSVKVGPNDLGSGNLHRQGRNFKPINEEIILAQRNKVQISKKKIKEASLDTRKGPPQKKKSNSTTTTTTTITNSSHKSPKPKHADIPPFTTLRPPQQNSAWSSTNLVETPFWESQNAKAITKPSHDTNDKLSSANEWGTIENGWGDMSKQQHTGWEEYDKKQNEKKLEQNNNNWGSLEPSKSPKKDIANEGWANVQTTPRKKETLWNNVDTIPKKKKEDAWGEEKDSGGGWSKSPKNEKDKTSNDAEVNAGGWSSWSSDQFLEKPVPDKSSWLPITSPPPSAAAVGTTSQSSRFSIASKQRYTPNIDVPEPMNYKRNGKPAIPTATAPPPPPENRHLITINVELSSENKISVNIRELDNPLQLAKDFAKNHNISSDKVVEALTNLFSTQKDKALKLKNKKLQRRVPIKPVHNNYFPDYSPYESSPAYQRPTFTNSPPTTTTTTTSFARRSYY